MQFNRVEKIKHCFNKAAISYDAHSDLQLRVGKELINLIAKKNAQKIIDIGCGTGIVTMELAKKFHQYSQFTAIDIAERLLEQAKLRLKTNEIIFQQHDFNYPFNAPVDLAFSNMALQWSNDLAVTIANIASNILPQGMLAFSLPLAETFLELSDSSNLAFYKLEQVYNFLQQAGCTVLLAQEQQKQQQFASFFKALKSIKLVGANFYDPNKGKNSNLTKLLYTRRLEQHFCLTYNIGFFIALKK